MDNSFIHTSTKLEKFNLRLLQGWAMPVSFISINYLAPFYGGQSFSWRDADFLLFMSHGTCFIQIFFKFPTLLIHHKSMFYKLDHLWNNYQTTFLRQKILLSIDSRNGLARVWAIPFLELMLTSAWNDWKKSLHFVISSAK